MNKELERLVKAAEASAKILRSLEMEPDQDSALGMAFFEGRLSEDSFYIALNELEAAIKQAQSAQAEPEPDNWGNEDMAAAPLYEMLRLYVRFDENPTDDISEGDCAATIGFRDDDGWHIAGWCWTHDRFTEGKGEPVAWLPMLSAAPQQKPEPTEQELREAFEANECSCMLDKLEHPKTGKYWIPETASALRYFKAGWMASRGKGT